jgi:DNA-binding NarL/FixJ family response regulator
MRIVIAEDDDLVRQGIALALADGGFEIAGEAADADETRRLVPELRPDVLVTDVHMPPGEADDGLRAAIDLRRASPELGVVVLSQDIAVPYLMEILEHGPRGIGYLLKQRATRVAEFCAAIERVAAGGAVVDPNVVAAALGRFRPDDPVERLADPERDTLALLAEGWSDAEIAERLGEDPEAIGGHFARIAEVLELPPAQDVADRVRAVIRRLNAD